ncbi:MAG: glycosyltransferase [Bacteroidetes bacterium]|nr:glycosyltransferase [Bacteroidota bacterium]MBU1115824.1 glycosyltransferase [Bacteroidota bacterium]MBU1800217.1 glycosyltransferase [Bacteroidota bacterium]
MLNILSFVFLGLLIFYFLFIRKIRVGITKLSYFGTQLQDNEFVSVIIPFRNESEKIMDNLKSIESQNYPSDKFEVIYIDDFSTDDSLKKLKNGITKENIFVYSIKDTNFAKAHKKQAIEFGISKSKGTIILFTDADCTNFPNWISTMVIGFEENTALISGPVAFAESDNLFGKLQSLEFAGLILSGAGLIGNKTPMIASSANLAFRKSVFDEVGGYKDLMNLSSGDDELLMQKIAYKTNYDVKFCFEKDALVITDANKNLEEFNQQRKRWASKGLFYENKLIVAQLFLIFLFYLGLIAQLLLGFFLDPRFLKIFSVSFMLKILVEYAVMVKGVGVLIEKINFPLFLLAEILHIPYIVYSAISGALGNFTWKDRELKR